MQHSKTPSSFSSASASLKCARTADTTRSWSRVVPLSIARRQNAARSFPAMSGSRLVSSRTPTRRGGGRGKLGGRSGAIRDVPRDFSAGVFCVDRGYACAGDGSPTERAGLARFGLEGADETATRGVFGTPNAFGGFSFSPRGVSRSPESSSPPPRTPFARFWKNAVSTRLAAGFTVPVRCVTGGRMGALGARYVASPAPLFRLFASASAITDARTVAGPSREEASSLFFAAADESPPPPTSAAASPSVSSGTLGDPRGPIAARPCAAGMAAAAAAADLAFLPSRPLSLRCTHARHAYRPASSRCRGRAEQSSPQMKHVFAASAAPLTTCVAAARSAESASPSASFSAARGRTPPSFFLSASSLARAFARSRSARAFEAATSALATEAATSASAFAFNAAAAFSFSAAVSASVAVLA